MIMYLWQRISLLLIYFGAVQPCVSQNVISALLAETSASEVSISLGIDHALSDLLSQGGTAEALITKELFISEKAKRIRLKDTRPLKLEPSYSLAVSLSLICSSMGLFFWVDNQKIIIDVEPRDWQGEPISKVIVASKNLHKFITSDELFNLQSFRLGAYDAIYLDAFKVMGIELVTIDHDATLLVCSARASVMQAFEKKLQVLLDEQFIIAHKIQNPKQ